jgi:single-strand DNA-binding protein
MANKFIGLGRLTADPIYKTTETGTSITSFTIAIRRNFKNKNNEYDSDFLNCVSYKNTADFINKYFKKGDMICVEGRVQVRNYDDKDGNKKYVTEIVVESAEFVGPKKEESSTISKMETDEIKVPQNYKSDYEGGNDTSIVLADSDLPF